MDFERARVALHARAPAVQAAELGAEGVEARIERDSVRVDQVARLLAELREAWANVKAPAVV